MVGVRVQYPESSLAGHRSCMFLYNVSNRSSVQCSFTAPDVEVEVGTLPNILHDVGGTLILQGARTIIFKNFEYDGAGPG